VIALIPGKFLLIRYNGAHYPGSSNTKGLEGGANCQQFAYELLRYFGLSIPDFRSRELWQDTAYTHRTDTLDTFDLLLWNKNEDPYGAHVGVYVGDGKAIHLSKENVLPAIEPLEKFHDNPAYRVFIGAKRVFSKTPNKHHLVLTLLWSLLLVRDAR
jgi:cell wall-associated NlpC family hydrolase